MHAMFRVTAGLLICFGLCGCNRNHQAQTTAPATVAATAPACNCPRQAAVPEPPVTHHRHHVDRRWHRESLSHEASWSESTSTSYSSSDESGYSDARDNQSDGMAGAPIPPPPPDASYPPPQAEGGVWVDGYGREHYAMDTPEADDGAVAELTEKDIRRRLAPYHAYDVDCDRPGS